MKKFSIVAALAIAISGIFASCGNSPAKANLKNDVDTLSYAIGMAQTQAVSVADGHRHHLYRRIRKGSERRC